ncbi:MAG: AAA family ATPase, partial [Lachnospiraceae bacterium]|nr:AAA family ATPase [Lachnospiraceae bacterium]
MSEAKNIIVPEDLRDFISVEHCDDFPIDRYMLTHEQAQIGNDIKALFRRSQQLRQYNIDYLNATLLYGVPGTGKAQPLSSLVLTPSGYKKMGDIKEGDMVMSPDGKPVRVSGVYPQGKKAIYRMRFSDGASCECSGEHLWEVTKMEHRDDTLSSGRSIYIMTTLELIEAMSKGTCYGVRCVGKIDIDSGEEPDSVDRAVEKIRSDPGHIPDRFMKVPYDTRLKIFNKLIGREDDDEYKTMYIASVRKSMIYCVYRLAWSLGIITDLLDADEGAEVSQVLLIYPGENAHNVRMITYITPEEREEQCQCIFVDSPEHLYVTDCYTVTHNTTFGRYIAYKFKWDFAFINFANLVGGVMGDTARNITRVFNFMADQKCIFMMDEIDCISVKRGNEAAATGGELSRITITVMQNLDAYKRKRVESIIIAATNVISTVDPALMSRFAIKKEIKPWNNADKEKFVIKYLGTIPGLEYNRDNIHRYCTENSTLQQRE